jgi:hypothetical protein
MKREIKFDNTELTDLIQIIKICQPEYGSPSDTIVRLIALYYKKYGVTSLFFERVGENNFISAKKSTVTQNKQTISIEDIIIQLKDMELLKVVNVQGTNSAGEVQYHNTEKTFPVTRRMFVLDDDYINKLQILNLS